MNKDPKEEIPFIKRELAIHKKLDHPNITRLEGSLEDQKHYYAFLEYAKNGDLYEFIKTFNFN